MPIYVYKCTSCKYYEEILHSIHEMSKYETCPNCRRNTFNRIPTAANFMLVGDGFYKNDYGDKK